MSNPTHTYDQYPLALRRLLVAVAVALRWCPTLDPREVCEIVIGACKMTKERMR